MNSVTLNRYKGIYKNMAHKAVVAADPVKAATLLMDAEQANGILSTVQLLEEGIMVDTPPQYTDFVTVVTPSVAQMQGAVALPSKYRVPVGTKVLFECKIPEGFTFNGWYINVGSVLATVPAATVPVAELTIPSTSDPSEVVQVEARLVQAP